MKIAEVYSSIQGEGLLTGTPSVFVRASGCNLRCEFCDTPFASWQPEGEDLDVDAIIRAIDSHEPNHVVVTGGEPMLFAELLPLCQRLRELSYHVTIETAGTLYLPVTCDLMSISPKTSNSTPTSLGTAWQQRHDRARWAPDVLRKLIQQTNYQIKFVVASPDDISEIDEFLSHFSEIDRSKVFLMPEGTDQQRLESVTRWLLPICQQEGLRLGPREQIRWFGTARGT